MKVLANDGIAPIGKQMLEEAGFEVITDKVEQDGLAAFINENNIEVLLVRSATKVRKDLIDACPGLKSIGRGGVGLDNIDVAYANEKGVEVFNTPKASSQAVAELVMGHLISLCRGLHDANRQMPVKGDTEFGKLKKKYAKGIEIYGKTLGIVGLGRIGRYTARYAVGLGMKVIGVDPYAKDVNIDFEVAGVRSQFAVKQVSFDELLTHSDFISLHIPAQSNGRAVIGAEEIGKMKDGAIVINLARGGLIDEQALLDGLNSGKLSGAALDVFENEPTPRRELLQHEKISLSPHIGAATLEAQSRIGEEIANHLIEKFGRQ